MNTVFHTKLLVESVLSWCSWLFCFTCHSSWKGRFGERSRHEINISLIQKYKLIRTSWDEIFCDTGYFVWIEFGRSIQTFPHILSKFWLLLLTLKQSCIHLIFFSLFKLFLISRPVTFHEEWKHFEISCFSHFRNQWHLWLLFPVRVIVVWNF